MDRAFLVRDLVMLDYRSGTRAGRGFLIGFTTGVALAAALVLTQGDTEDFNKVRTFPVAAGLFGVVGGLLGLAFGSTAEVWIKVGLPRRR